MSIFWKILQFPTLSFFIGVSWFSGVAVGSGRQAVVAYINIGSYYFVGIPLGILLGWLLPSGIVVSAVTTHNLNARIDFYFTDVFNHILPHKYFVNIIINADNVLIY